MFIPYRKLNYIILASFLVIVIVVLTYSAVMLPASRQAATIFTTSSTVRTCKTLEIDANGNGRDDTVIVKIDEDRKEYSIEIVNDNKKKYILSPGSKSCVLGPYVEWWPLQITVADINMDKIPEILVQVSRSAQNSPMYIFRWDGNEYKCILSGSYEGLSFADVTGDMVPEAIAEERMPGIGETYTVYMWVANSYSRINYELDIKLHGYDKVQSIIKLLGAPFHEKLPSDKYLNLLFADQWIKDVKNREYLNNFAKDVVGIQLQDYISEDMAKAGKEPYVLSSWRLRYLVFRKYGTNVRAENYIAEIELQKPAGPGQDYRIFSIKFKGQ